MLERARAAGVQTLLAIGSGTGTNRLDAAIPFAEQHDWIYATVGIHPHEANDVTEEHLRAARRAGAASARDRLGRDGPRLSLRSFAPDVQQRVFRRQLEQARAARLPIVIHCRDAWPDCLEILEEDWRPTGLGGIFHCFTGTLEEARRGLDMGFLISFAGNVTYPKAQPIRDVAREFRWTGC